MIERLSMRKRRVLFFALMIGSVVFPFVLLLPFLIRPSLLDSLSGGLVVATFLTAIASSIPFLVFAAKAAAWSDFRHGSLTVLLSWWVIGLAGALTNWSTPRMADSLIAAVTFDIIHPAADAAIKMPSAIAALGASSRFGINFPLYTIVLIVSYVLWRRSRLKLTTVPDSPLASAQVGAPLT